VSRSPSCAAVGVDHQVQYMSTNILLFSLSRSQVTPEINNPTVFRQQECLIYQEFFSIVAKGQKQMILPTEKRDSNA
jgi:hypothetical protein